MYQNVQEPGGNSNLSTKMLTPYKDFLITNNTFNENYRSSFKYYGGFYNDRLNIYYTEDPDLKVDNADVQIVYLYFLDSVLAKIKYQLNKNVSVFLIDSLGAPSLRVGRKEEISVIEQEKIIFYNNNGYQLNPKLKNYKLVWREADALVVFEVRETGTAHDSLDIPELYEIKDKYSLDVIIKEYKNKLIRLDQ